jgi:hypothetical protein
MIKAWFARVWAKREAHESHLMLPGVQKSVREWTFTLPSELSSWELESQMDFQIFREQLQGSKLNGSKRFLYHWKTLGTYVSKMGLHDPFEHLKHKLWPKEMPGVKLPIWLPNTKNQELTRFPCVQVVYAILLESSWQGIKLFFRLHRNWRFTHEVMGPKVVGVPIVGISGLPFGNPKTKCHLDVGLVERHKVWRAPKSRGETHLRVSQSQVAESWDSEARSWLPTLERGGGSSWEPRD